MGYLQNMCPDDLKAAIEEFPLFIATGTIEFHGSQLPLGTDLIITEGIIREIEKRTNVIVAPSFSFCPTGYMVSGPNNGTADIHIGTFIEYCSEILLSYKKMGFRKIYVIVHHQSDSIAKYLECAVDQVNLYSLNEEYGDGWWTNKKEITQTCEIKIMPAVFGSKSVKETFGGHGGVGETQAIMALSPDSIMMNNIKESEPWWNSNACKADKIEADKKMNELIVSWLEILS